MTLTKDTLINGTLSGAIAAAALLMTNLTSHAAPLTAAEATELGTEAYIYGYPLITMEYTRRVITNVPKVEGTHGPMGQLIRLREYPTAEFKDVTAPNADTLYTTCFLDVGKEPYVLSLPDAHGRYYLFPMLDGWTDVFQVPGKRTTGTGPQKYAITGPGWKGTLPKDVKDSTNRRPPLCGFLGVSTAQARRMTMQPCTSCRTRSQSCHSVPTASSYTPPEGKVDPSIDMKTPVRDQVNALTAEAYFSLLATLLKDNPPAKADGPMVAKLTKLGVVPGEAFNASKLGEEAAKALADVPKLGFEKIMGHFKEAGTMENGWTFTTKTGLYGTDYLQRALVTAIGLGANRPQDAVYPTSEVDADGKPYSGANKYVMHFPKGQLPPANGFWSLTMYNGEYFFVANPLNRYSISARQNLKANADGSTDLYIQNESPGADKESNWLPAPADKFILMLRLYWPKEKSPSIINGTWKIPAVKLVK